MRWLLAAALLAALAAPAASAGEGADKKLAKSLRKCAPATYEAAVECLDKILPPEHQAALASPDGAINGHFGLGMVIRNNWGLWNGGRLFQSMQALGFRHPDDMSGAILEGFAARERGESYRPTPPDYAALQREWDRAVEEGRAGSFSCPEPVREARTRKEIKAEMEACMAHMVRTLEEEPK